MHCTLSEDCLKTARKLHDDNAKTVCRLMQAQRVTALLRDQGAGENEYPFRDLDSMPWKDNPGLLLSAWKRVRQGEWKWRQVINEETDILKGRKANGFKAQPFDAMWRQKAQNSKGKKKDEAEEDED